MSQLEEETIESCAACWDRHREKEEILDSEIEEMIAARQQARKDKDFALADEIHGRASFKRESFWKTPQKV